MCIEGNQLVDHKVEHADLSTEDKRQEFMKGVVAGLAECKKASDVYMTDLINKKREDESK